MISQAADHTAEKAYLAQPDTWRQALQHDLTAGDATQAAALQMLSQQMRSLLAPAPKGNDWDGGRYAIKSLLPGDGGNDQLDGLIYTRGDMKLLVTTPYLLRQFVSVRRDLRRQRQPLLHTAQIYSSTLDWNATLVPFATVPVGKPPKGTQAYALIGAWLQDEGAVLPDTLTVTVIQGQRVYFSSQPIAQSLTQSDRCIGVYGHKGYQAYLQCWRASAPGQAGFLQVKQQAIDVLSTIRALPQ